MRLSEYLRRDLVIHGLDVSDRPGALRAISDVLLAADLVSDGEVVYEALRKREEAHTTALGDGVAVPHAVLPSLAGRLLVVATTQTPIPYGSGEDDVVDILFVLLSPPGKEGEHIKLLARICRLARHPGFLDNLRAASTGEDLHQAILHQDSQHV
jgi:mannitol/fructose-specific phosphotransferase system IIA component (Ntr-type)